MRIAFLSNGDVNNPNASSGLPHFIFHELAKREIAVAHIATHRVDRFGYRVNAALRLAGVAGYDPFREDMIAKIYYVCLNRKIKEYKPDVIFAVLASQMVARLETEVPIVHFSDTTFAAMLNYYPEFTNLSHRTVQQGNQMEARALKRARVVLLPSQWAAESAIRDYEIDPAKVFVVPLGANLRIVPDPPPESGNCSDVCRLLFVGVDWERKGGDFALSVLDGLLDRGVKAELHIVGCYPSAGQTHPHMYCHGFLSKTLDYEKLEKLFSEATFFMLPSRQEAYGLVFAEASAFGVPSLATRTGGIPSVVQHGQNGFLFASDAGPYEYVEKICDVWGDKTTYRELRRSSQERFAKVLNWTVWGDKVEEIIRKYCWNAP